MEFKVGDIVERPRGRGTLSCGPGPFELTKVENNLIYFVCAVNKTKPSPHWPTLWQLVSRKRIFLVNINGRDAWQKVEAESAEDALNLVHNKGSRIDNARVIDNDLVQVFQPTMPQFERVR